MHPPSKWRLTLDTDLWRHSLPVFAQAVKDPQDTGIGTSGQCWSDDTKCELSTYELYSPNSQSRPTISSAMLVEAGLLPSSCSMVSPSRWTSSECTLRART